MSIPTIAAVTGENRPEWSVMIPAYEPGSYLEKTLNSVLIQDPGSEAMQIEVVDDCSQRENLKDVVDRVGSGRIGYYRQPKNVGAIANFNTCVERSRGRWVHILHGDDTVLPGFYLRLREATDREGLGAAFCRHVFVDEDDHWQSISRLERRQAGLLDRRSFEDLIVWNIVQTPSIVVRRSVYEEIGGYDTRLFHAADWDMWKRIAIRYPVWYEPAILACFRVHPASDTSRLVRTGRNIENIRRAISLMEERLPRDSSSRLSNRARRQWGQAGIWTANMMLQKGDYSAAMAQAREALKTSRSLVVFRGIAGLLLRGSRKVLGRALRSGRRPAPVDTSDRGAVAKIAHR
jgi:glycosyltransferase involved in cell wall biosynthesis